MIRKLETHDNATLYQGDVTIKLMKGRKTYKTIEIHNTASSEFFTILCNAVIGNNVASSMPKLIGLYNSNDEQIAYNKVSYSTCSVSSETINSVITPFAQFEFIIPSQFIIGGETLKRIKLFNNVSDSATALATVELGTTKEVVLDSSSNLMVVWKLSFHNVSN